ncbi:hypothetical protein L9F63_019096, partial [Diploptera punctata]
MCDVCQFAVLLAVIFVLELSAGLAGYLLKDGLQDYLVNRLNVSMSEYSTNTEIAKTIDFTQERLQCCGLEVYDDWQGKIPSGTPGTETYDGNLVIPKSCCVDTCSTLYGNGCLPRVEYVIGRSAVMLASAAVSIALLQLLGVMFACSLGRTIRHTKTERERRRWELRERLLRVNMSQSSALVPLSIVVLLLLIVGSTQVRAQHDSTFKGWSGQIVSNDTVKQVYHHDQTVAFVELGPGKTLQNCELIEIVNAVELEQAFRMLRPVAQPINITFDEMFELMDQCYAFDSPLESANMASRIRDTVSLGIVPGTKWCGTSDIAATYHDLGKEKDVDKCCRTHDLCPVKVRSYRTRYNLTNENFFTKSHCSCDDRFWKCLKSRNTPLASLMGNVYFNIMRVPCVEETDTTCDKATCRSKQFRKARQFFL